MRANNILCEYLDNPIGIGITNPRITWTDEGLIEQKAFEIRYSINGGEYRTEKISSPSMNHVFKESFKSRDEVRYSIRICDENENWSEFSEEHSFEMGLINPLDWISKWITGNYKPNKKERYPVDCFKKEFSSSGTTKARLYISSCGIYEAEINGKRVGDFVLAPGSTDPRKRIQYQTYDVTSLIQPGSNEIKVLLANGWYRGSIGAKGFTCVFGKETRLIAQLELYDDNGKTTVVSDGTWNWSNDGEIRFADLKDGEIVDARMSPSFSSFARETDFKANLEESNNESVVEIGKNRPVKMWQTKNGNTILEFENNVAGYMAFDVSAHDGDRLDISLGEMLDEEGEVTLKNIQCIRKDKKTPLQEIHYTCREGMNHYHSKFFMAGFKYATISTKTAVSKDDFYQVPICTRLKETSEFNCSNELINIFYENTLRSLKSNSIDIPTDCPTRERMGWTGDSQVFFETATYLTDYRAFTRKHIVDVYDRQDKNGRLPQIAPYSAEDWFMNVMNGSVGWADVGILTPYRFYKKYGDDRLLRDSFANMERYARFMINRCGRTKGIYAIYAKPLHLSKENKKYQVNNGQSYGEWAEPNDVKAFVWTDFCMPHPEESMAYTCWMMRLMSEICDIVGDTRNKALYEEYAEGVKKAYQELITKPAHSFDTDRQAKLVRPLKLDLLTDEQKEFAKKRLIKALDNYGWRLGTGFLSTPFILSVLSEIDPEYAYRLLENEEMPGWLFMSKNNTGTIWEGWEGPKSQSGIASLNHYSKGAMVEWLFNGMCGINVSGENEFLLKPVIGGKETFASAKYDSAYGRVELSWKKDGDKVTVEFVVPSNTKARFVYGDKDETVCAGRYSYTF